MKRKGRKHLPKAGTRPANQALAHEHRSRAAHPFASDPSQPSQHRLGDRHGHPGHRRRDRDHRPHRPELTLPGAPGRARPRDAMTSTADASVRPARDSARPRPSAPSRWHPPCTPRGGCASRSPASTVPPCPKRWPGWVRCRGRSRLRGGRGAGVRGRVVAGVPPLPSRLLLAGHAGVVLAVGGRGLLGIIGRTDLVAPGEVTERFRRWDRRLYTPLCLGLAAGTGAPSGSIASRPGRTGARTGRTP